ncbi:DUF3021 domain-containing protein [Pseudoflavonifractor capillosus]|uniref:DUF3021 domain-containing protein n=1 Tax=Pseudoflavonifractor capillosus TaxID=106588 RepID=A0A921MNS3_9FIRM|nr:DUF3021 domain-containing protein [Pseudoflavonifractor capillosus]HJG87244.1 DUF3021 domain-containing protein [Pseudoflavonifractor capillosus]
MTDRQKQWLIRILLGGLIGIAALIPLGGVFNGLVSGGLIAMGPNPIFRLVSYDLEYLTGSAPLAFAIQLGLYFLMGAVVGLSTLPFADDGPTLVLRSLAHFAATAGTLTVLVVLCGWNWGEFWPVALYLGLLAAVYLLIWLGRWVGWYVEVAAIRQRLGLSPGPSPLKWRETLPYLPFAALMCLVLPMVLRLCESPIPIFSAIYAMLILPAGGFFSGLFLGRRQGFCPLYPVVCALLTLCFVLLARLVSNVADGAMIPIVLCSVLLGNTVGALFRTVKERRMKK